MIESKYLYDEKTDIKIELEKDKQRDKKILFISIITLLICIIIVFLPNINLEKNVILGVILAMTATIVFTLILLLGNDLIVIRQLEKSDFYENFINKRYKLYSNLFFADMELVYFSIFSGHMKKIKYSDINKIDAVITETYEYHDLYKHLIVTDNKGRKHKIVMIGNPSSKKNIEMVKSIVNELQARIPNIELGKNIFATKLEKYYNLKQWLLIIAIFLGFILLGVLGKVISILL